MRVTIDLPDGLHRLVKQKALSRKMTMKQMVIGALEKELAAGRRRAPFPMIDTKSKRKLDLSNFDFDDLLG